MSADLQELFDRAGRNPPGPAFDADGALRRARRLHHRRITGAVAATVVVTLALGAGLASQWNQAATPDPAAPRPTAPVLGSLGRLAFGLNGDIYVADGDGTDRVRVADGTEDACSNYWAEGPVWSPDGRYFVYRGADDGGDTTTSGCSRSATVHVSDASGDRIASFPGEGWRVSWSPDSRRLALWAEFGRTLGIYGLDGVRQALLAVPPAGMMSGDFDPVWSLDGDSLLLRGGVEVPIDGSTPRQLPSDDPRSQLQFAYSRDGADVSYVSKEGLTVAAADGSQARVLASTGVNLVQSLVFGPAWSPTGDRIAFVFKPSVESAGGGRVNKLAVIDVASGAVVPLADLGGANSSNSMLTFSPEGDQILFTRTEATGATSLWSVHTDGSDPHRLVAGSNWGDWQTVTPQR